MKSRRARSECWAALAVVVGAVMLFWPPAGAGAIGEHIAVSHAALHATTVADHALPSVPSAGTTKAADDVTHGADAIADGVGKVGDVLGAAADRLLPGRDRDGDSSDRCGNDCPPPSDDHHAGASGEHPAPGHNCDDACHGSSASGCASADCPPPSSDKCAKDCPSPSDDHYDRASRERPAPEHNCADTCHGSSAGGCASPDCPPRSSEPGRGACQEPADCRRPCGQCPGQDERPEPPPAPERNRRPDVSSVPAAIARKPGAVPGVPPRAQRHPPASPRRVLHRRSPDPRHQSRRRLPQRHRQRSRRRARRPRRPPPAPPGRRRPRRPLPPPPSRAPKQSPPATVRPSRPRIRRRPRPGPT